MHAAPDIYVPGSGLLYRIDARIKVVLLIMFSVAVFFVETWAGLGLLSAFLVAAVLLSRLRLARFVRMSLPVLALLLVIVACNSLVGLEDGSSLARISGVSAGFAEGWKPIALGGFLAFSPEGCVKGLFYLARILLVVWASFALAFTAQATELSRAFSSLLAPLRVFRFPVDDAAMVCCLVLRFIPLAWESYFAVRDAQLARGARYDQGGLWTRVRGYLSLMVPLFVALFRQADRLATAMDARCYGLGASGGSAGPGRRSGGVSQKVSHRASGSLAEASVVPGRRACFGGAAACRRLVPLGRTSLNQRNVSASDVVILFVACVLLVACAFAF